MSVKIVKHKRNDRPPERGDIVAIEIKDKGWLSARVAVVNAHADTFGSWNNCYVLYVFRFMCENVQNPSFLGVRDLLFPPQIVDREGWTSGKFLHVCNRIILDGEVVPQHCFVSPMYSTPRYYNEFDKELEQKLEPCGHKALTTVAGIELEIANHLDRIVLTAGDGTEVVVPHPQPAALCPDRMIAVVVPASFAKTPFGLSGIEEKLERIAKQRNAGEWIGHGFDNQSAQWDIRFREYEKMDLFDAFLDAADTLGLPRGSFLYAFQEGSDEPQRKVQIA